MRQKVTHVTESAQFDAVQLLGRDDWRVTVNNTTKDHLSFVLSQPGLALHYKMVFEKGGLRFERQAGAAPSEFLQRDLVTGVVTWNSSKPYRSSGREMVQVNLGLEMLA